MVRIVRSVDAMGGEAGVAGGVLSEAGGSVSEAIGRIEGRATYELSCYVRACMMRTGFA
jgi:hypothetical protein